MFRTLQRERDEIEGLRAKEKRDGRAPTLDRYLDFYEVSFYFHFNNVFRDCAVEQVLKFSILKMCIFCLANTSVVLASSL
jgi:hypothetical protein